jgi:hypothetical protein
MDKSHQHNALNPRDVPVNKPTITVNYRDQVYNA